MLRISQLKLPVTHTEEDLKKKIVHTLMCRTEAVQSYEIIKQSLDARAVLCLYCGCKSGQ